MDEIIKEVTLMIVSFLGGLISNLCGTVVGLLGSGALAYWIARQQFKIQSDAENSKQRIDTGLVFYEEFTSDSFSQARLETTAIFNDHLDANNLNDFYPTLAPERKQSIIKVLSFFRRLQLAVQYQSIDDRMAIELFSGEFIRWYFEWLNKLVPTNWATRKNIDNLNEWLQKNMSQTDYEDKKTEASDLMSKRQAQLDIAKDNTP